MFDYLNLWNVCGLRSFIPCNYCALQQSSDALRLSEQSRQIEQLQHDNQQLKDEVPFLMLLLVQIVLKITKCHL